MNEQNQRDDALFEQLRSTKKKKRRKILLTVGIVLAVTAVALLVAVSQLRSSVRERFASAGNEVLSYTAETGTLHTLVSGSGTVAYVDEEDISVPAGVEVEEVTVERQDTVAKGDILATVNMATVLQALSDTQSAIDDLDEQIHDAEGDKVSSTLTAGVTGRVKLVYGEKGDDVASVMAENGALAVLSLDGYLSCSLETDALKTGDAVTVTCSDGTEREGTVESVLGTTATILVSDDGPKVGDTVTVSDSEGTALGTGELEIHAPLRITGYAGTISAVQATENRKVYSGTQLFTLTNTQVSTNYQSLLRSREEQEDILLQLLTIYQDGAVLAPYDGLVCDIVYDEDTANTAAEQTLVTLTPDKKMEVTISVGEADILSLEVGQTAEVTVSSVREDAFQGIVAEVTRTNASGSYSAKVSFDKLSDVRMLPGMSADVNIQIQGVENAILVPVDAVHQTSAISYVYTSYNEETKEYGGMVEVTTGLWGDKYVEITSGLKVGDVVYYTEAQSFSFGFGGMAGMSGMSVDDLPISKIMNSQGGGDFGGGQGGGNMPDMGGGRPDGGGRP